MSTNEFSFLKAFNAKEMPDSSVARTFVTSEKFSQLAGAWNALILGPRGSGKTTLLKMLRLPALRMWDGEDANHYRSEIDFTGIFVPADIAWSEMAEALGRRRLPPELQESVVQCVFCVNVLLALVEAFDARINPTEGAVAEKYRCITGYDVAKLSEALRTICDQWKLQPRILSLHGIKAALQSRLLQIQAEISRLTRKAIPTEEEVNAALPFLHLHVTIAVEVAVEQFDAAINDPEGKWALLFDEFEIAPVEMQSLVFRRFRSAGKKVFYKVGLAPCTAHTMGSLAAVSEATPRNDYRQIELWYPDKKSAFKFSTRLFNTIFGQDGQINALDTFGANYFVVDDDDSLKSESHPYGKGDHWKQVFESLRKKDESFRRFLKNKKIDPSNLETAPDTLTGNTIRKIAPLVAFRDAFRREGGPDVPQRGRKKLNFAYSGWEAISAICEGNPRWLIGVISMMFAADQQRSSVVKPSTQVDKIREATDSFSAMLSMVPLASRGIKTNEPIDKLLRQIGEYFFARVVQDEFVEEPPLSFRVDTKVSSDVQAAIRIAINHGALINIPDSNNESLDFDELVGKRFRLAYLLAPRFKLPLRSTKEASLSTILTHAKVVNTTGTLPTQSQLNLLGDL